MDRYDIDRDTAVLTEGDACNLVREGIFAMGRTPKIFKPPPPKYVVYWNFIQLIS